VAMAKEFKLPDLGEGLTEAEIVQVLVAEGDEVKEDQPVLLVETEKAQVELPSPFGGRVSKINVRAGQRVKVGSVLMSFADAGGRASGSPGRSSADPQGGGPARRVADPRPPPRTAGTGDGAPPLARKPPPAATPATRRLAREMGVDLADVAGSGPAGRITDE